MNNYGAKIVCDSVNPDGKRLTTWALTYPRFVHSELMTHRVFSRNSASSRALSSSRLRDRIQENPVMPVQWGKKQSKMQADGEIAPEQIVEAKKVWRRACQEALRASSELDALGVHKQLVNRVVEPWMFITVVVTATEWGGWYQQRVSPLAQPEIAWVANAMYQEMVKSKPTRLALGEWHMPFVTAEDWCGTIVGDYPEHCRTVLDLATTPLAQLLLQVSVARCARTSYLTHDGIRSVSEDLALFDRLMRADPKHWSPMEHQAKAITSVEWNQSIFEELMRCDEVGEPFNPMFAGNLVGWAQLRKHWPFLIESGFLDDAPPTIDYEAPEPCPLEK